MLRTVAAASLVLIAGLWALYGTTLGLRAFTAETARRVAVREQPRPVPDMRLQLQDGRDVRFSDLRGRLVVATFMYTSCHSICPVVGARMAEIRSDMRPAVDRGELQFLSLSFDPTVDTPERLAGYAENFAASTEHWWVARPRDSFKSLLRLFGVTVIPAGNGMYVHNAAFYLIDRDQRLVDILDEDRPDAVRQALEPQL